MQKTLSTLVAFSALLQLGNAGGFLKAQHVSLVQNKEMPITTHDKDAGEGYKKGSPLYKKQQDIAKNPKKASLKEPESNKVVHVTTPPEEKAVSPSYWWNIYGGEKGHVYSGLLSFIIYFIDVMFVALIWTKCARPGRTKEGTRERQNNGITWAYGLFSFDHCFGHHANVCFCSWCCAPLRLADTYNKDPMPVMKSFWGALIIITCLLGLGQLSFGLTSLVFLCLATHFRQQLRKKYGLESGGTTCCTDCLSWFFCPFCSMAQEARQVEFVMPDRQPVSKPGFP